MSPPPKKKIKSAYVGATTNIEPTTKQQEEQWLSDRVLDFGSNGR